MVIDRRSASKNRWWFKRERYARRTRFDALRQMLLRN